ncbi:MAG: hypothetical protein ABMA64_03895 [Myxococcota bacterium]
MVFGLRPTASPVLFALALAGCSEREFNVQNIPPPSGDLSLSGRVCNPQTHTWMENALVYTHLYDATDVVYDTRSTTTDADGRWTLTELVADKEYEVYVQVGQDIIDKFLVSLEGESGTVPDPACAGTPELNVAVITGAYDELAPLLDAIGMTGSRVIDGQAGTEIVDFLTDPAAMAEYDVVFFDGGHREDGVIYGAGPEVTAVRDTIRSYVQAGGVVFASDWAYDVVEQIWPAELEFYGDDAIPDDAQVGDIGTVDAEVVDADLSLTLGLDRMDVTYDLPVWPVVESAGPGVTVYLSGAAPWRIGLEAGTVPDSPLLVGFDDGDGRVLLTTYRNAANNTDAMLGVLLTLVQAL